MSGALLAVLDRDLGGLALLWRLTRMDGVVLGFTTHDRSIRMAGLTFRSSSGVSVSAVSSVAGLDADGMTFRGAVEADAVRRDDLMAGRWRDAKVTLMLCDWERPQDGAMVLARGRVTEWAMAGVGSGAFTMELLPDVAMALPGRALRCAPLCRAQLGDGRCGVDMAGRVRRGTIGAVAGRRVTLSGVAWQPEHMVGGRLRVVSGAGTGLEFGVDAADADGLVLAADFAGGDVLSGARVLVTEGCDKRFATCVERFGNGAAFDGEPHLPGRDALVRYGAL